MAEADSTEEPPWVFRYVEDAADETARRLGQPPPMRPLVAIRLRAVHDAPRVTALVDSGSERTLAAPGLARAIGADLRDAPRTELGIGGRWRHVRFTDVAIQLFRDVLNDEEPPLAEWTAEVGFFDTWEPSWAVVLGQRGFFDVFTVTMHRAIPALAVEPWEAFDQRFGVQIETTETRQPRFQP